MSQCVTCCVGFCCTLLNWGTGRNGIFLAVEGLALRCNCMTSQQTLVDQTMQTHWRIPYATNNVSSSQPLAQELETHAGRIGHAGLVLFGFPSDWNKLTCRQRFQQVSASAPHEPLFITQIQLFRGLQALQASQWTANKVTTTPSASLERPLQTHSSSPHRSR